MPSGFTRVRSTRRTAEQGTPAHPVLHNGYTPGYRERTRAKHSKQCGQVQAGGWKADDLTMAYVLIRMIRVESIE